MTQKKLELYYDEEGDYLEIYSNNHESDIFKNVGDGVFHIVDEKTKKIKGIAISCFRKRNEKTKTESFTLPFVIK